MRRIGSVVIALVTLSCSSPNDVPRPPGGLSTPGEPSGDPAGDSESAASIDTSRAASLGAALDVRTRGCGPREGFGSASLIDDDIAITAAHVVAGTDVVTLIDRDRVEHDATVVAIDPDLDVALLRVPPGLGAPLQFLHERVEAGDVAAVTVMRNRDDTGDPATLDVHVLRRANVATTDIYRERSVVRPGFEISGEILPGDSGTVVVIGGRAAGVVWSRSLERDGRAWVVTIPDGYLNPAERRTLVDRVDTGDCA